MKYNELINFEPITTIVKLVTVKELSVAENLVRTFVFSRKMKEDIQEVIIKNLIPNPPYETKGIQIVGNYGTGKSHLMALISAIAENASLLEFLPVSDLKNSFKGIAGKYKVLRFEIGTDKPLKEIVFAQIERFLSQLSINYSFDLNAKFSWKESIEYMLAEFETKFADKHLLIVIDELLEYLKGRQPTELSNDLMLLRQLGEACDNSRFKLMFGVQELLYRSPEFQFQAEMLNKIEDRYSDLIITKEDVSFVVKNRLLKKDEHQKAFIRDHLLKFAHLFENINSNLNEFVELFPVHPNFINYFEKIKHGKSQREILKVLSQRFDGFMENEVPSDTPGLITIDSYWNDLSEPSMMTFPDIRVASEKIEIVSERIQSHFSGARKNRRELAKKIANTLAIRILCDDLDKRNGSTSHGLKEDICTTISAADSAELLEDIFESTAKQLVTATSGQYIDIDPLSNEFYLRTEGGINIPQLVRDYADEVLKREPQQADQYFFDFLQYILEIQQNSYRTGFKIWQHSIEWLDKKSFRLGYIFFGNPNERSTTEPIQQFYLFFSPLYGKNIRNDQPDEVYFDFTGLSDSFKDVIRLFGAAKAKEASASTAQKPLFRQQIDENIKYAISLFEKEFINSTLIFYKGKKNQLKSFPLQPEGTSKEILFSSLASKLLNNYFNERFLGYPAFKELLQPLTSINFENRIKSALKRIINPSQPNRDGDAILSGLGLWNGQSLDIQNSKYAEFIKKKLQERNESAVLNRDEVLYSHYQPHNLWYSNEFNLEYQLQFIVLTALVYSGEIEISWRGNKTLSASNIESVLLVNTDEMWSWVALKKPQGIHYKAIKTLFSALELPDLSSELEKPETISKVIAECKIRVDRVVKCKSSLAKGIRCRNIPLLADARLAEIKKGLDGLHSLLDGIQSYTSYGKLKSFKYSVDELTESFKYYSHTALIEKLEQRATHFEKLAGYLSGALPYIHDSEVHLLNDIQEALSKLPNEITTENENDLKKFEALLYSLVDRYADYYMKFYTKYRLSSKDSSKKDELLQSVNKKLCDILKDSELLTAKDYSNWINIITSFKTADVSLTKSRVKEEPYQDFNPKEFIGKPLFSSSELEEQLESIVRKWTSAMRSITKDPGVKENLDLLKPTEKKLISEFSQEKITLTTENAVRLRDLLNQLSRGIEKIELDLDELRKQFDKPFLPQEAIAALTHYIDEICAGKERSKIRIIIK